jgi:hypothetical protein
MVAWKFPIDSPGVKKSEFLPPTGQPALSGTSMTALKSFDCQNSWSLRYPLRQDREKVLLGFHLFLARDPHPLKFLRGIPEEGLPWATEWHPSYYH